MHGLNWLDYFIMAIMAFSIIISLVRGFTREVLSVLAWIFAIWVALTFANDFSELLNPYIKNPIVRMGTAYFILFALSLVLTALINFLIIQIIAKIGLGSIDKLLGILFGFARGIVLVAVMLAFASLTGMPKQKYWQETYLLPYFNPLRQWMLYYVPTQVGNQLSELSNLSDEQRGKILIVDQDKNKDKDKSKSKQG